MPRERLERLEEDARSRRLTIVAAPAGSGKTTLLASWAAAGRRAGRPTAWYRVESTDASLPTFLAYVQLAFAEALGGDASARLRTAGQAWRSVEEAVAWLERNETRPLLLIIDDYHLLAGSGAEAGLGRLLDLAPPGFAVALGSRCVPSLDTSRWRLAGELLEVTGDDLRFRSWEVERLFRDHYGEVLRGDELGRLARRTEGWAAGLQFFHLATRDKPAGERARLLESLAGSPRLVRDYLARNVLAELPDGLRAFLVATCQLRRLSGPLCDRYLGTRGSASHLEELERRQVFTMALEDGTYRYHELLQAHLEQLLTEAQGEAGVRELAARAGALLEQDGAVAEAVLAWCRAERWDDAARVLGSGGDRLEPEGTASWLADVAPALLRSDPWLTLANARRLRAEGRWVRSVEAFVQAESAFGASEAAGQCRLERLALAAFVEADARPPAHWSSVIRLALRRAPASSRSVDWRAIAGEAAPGASLGMALGLVDLLAGRVRDARAALLVSASDPEADPAVVAAATIGAAAAGLLGNVEGACDELERGTALAERGGHSWLARLGRGAFAAAGRPSSTAAVELAAFRADAAGERDAWGEILYGLMDGWALLWSEPEPRDASRLGALQEAATMARGLGAGSLESWARALEALIAVRRTGVGAREATVQAESLARSSGVRGALVPAYLALAESDPAHATDHLAVAEAIELETGLALPRDGRRRQTSAMAGIDAPEGRSARGVEDAAGTLGAGPPPLEICLLGGFAMHVAGRAVNLGAIKPRPRAMLRLLALNAGRPVHREVLAATFWPDADPDAAARNVHVAISGLRRELGPVDGSESELLAREGDAYRLVVPSGTRIDLADVEDALALARTARASGDGETEATAVRRAIELGSDELLPEDGPAEWVIYRREELRTALVAAIRALVESIEAADPEPAAELCSTGLRLDPHHDGLWRLLIATHERAGDHAAAGAARQGYARVLEQLGVGGAEDASPAPRPTRASRPQTGPSPPPGAPPTPSTGGPGTRSR